MKIAVVIPALDEAHNIQAAVGSAQAPGAEVVVVDGGSRDDTVERARLAGVKVMESAPGRSRQLRVGVDATAGEALVFLHADTVLPERWEAAVEDALSDPGVSGGAFRLRFPSRGLGLRLLEAFVRVRVALFALPYGDQAIFVRREVLAAIGGVPDVCFMEDLDLVRAMRTRGRVVALPLAATTSARRYEHGGGLRTAALHALAVLGWGFGVDRARLQSWVRR